MQAYETYQALLSLRVDLALALRAAAHQGLSEGVCNHVSVAVPGRADWFLLNEVDPKVRTDLMAV